MKDRAAWRKWLARNHDRSPGIWLVYDRKAVRTDRLAHMDAVAEALCFGWIDSTSRSLDDARYVQLFTPRKPKSTWSRVNKELVKRLEADGLMHDAGRAAIETARRNGSWTSLDAVEAFIVPPDLADALAAQPAAKRHFDAFAPSVRKTYLHWIAMAVRPATRAARIAQVVTLAATNRRTRT